MGTAPLKSFATWARTALIREVTARVAIVLAPASPERVEQPKAVAALEKAVSAAGASDKGRAAVADRVAYTWFNRIIALRFMDANGYTGIGVVSPEAEAGEGQPEILAEAKRGNIDSVVVGTKTRDTVIGLLNGTRRSDDPQGEAYALLLADYCHHWNRAMPFMFEREGDFTELLIPANLLADDSVLNRAVKVLTAKVCQDVEVIGWMYQFYIEERHDEVLAGFKKNKKAGAAEIPAATQLFTPHWIVRYLVENSLGRLWMLNRPTSHLVDQMEYYIAPVDKETDFLKISRPEELKLIDPACGSGHMLTYAFDLLYAIYEEEGYAPSDISGLILTHNIYGAELDPRAGALAAFALTMKGRVRQRTFFNKQVEPNICILEPIHFTSQELEFLLTTTGDRRAEIAFWNQFEHADKFGSLIQPNHELTARLGRHIAELDDGGDLLTADVIEGAEQVLAQAQYLAPRYSVVVTNPPYMGSGNMSGAVSAWIKDAYPDEKQDLYACFIIRSDELVPTGGFIALITGDTWMTNKVFEKLRRRLLAKHAFLSFVHMHDVSNHPDIFGANTAFVLAKDARPDAIGTFVYLDAANSEAKAQHLRKAVRHRDDDRVFLVQSSQFEEVPGAPIVYAASAQERRALASPPRIADLIETREGLTTGDNDRFLRRWYEVSHSRIGVPGLCDSDRSGFLQSRWYIYVKGGEFRRWYGNLEYVVDWEDDGARVKSNIDHLTGRVRSHNYNGEYAFLEGLSWSGISSSRFSVRHVSSGHMFDTKGPMGFSNDRESLLVAIAVLNSSSADRYLGMLAPNLDFKLGHVLSLPVPAEKAVRKKLAERAQEAVGLSENSWNRDELSYEFEGLQFDGHGVVTEWVSNRIAESECIDQRLTVIRNEIDEVIADAEGLNGATGRWRTPDDAVEYQPKALVKFLVYRSGQVPMGIGNWLLDLELAYGVFTADRTALVVQDLGLTAEGINEVVQAHEKFFNASKRVQSLEALLNPEDDAAKLRAKITAVVLGQREHSLLEITRTLLVESAKGQRTKYDALVDYGLDDFYWRGVARIYGYEATSPSIDDLVLWIFRKAIDGFKSDRPGGLQNIQLDFASLRNDRRSQDALAILAKRAARDLDYASKIEDASFRDLVAVDLFEETDQKIISDLARAVADQAVTAREVTEVVRARQSSAWIDGYRQLYTAVASASELLGELTSLDLAVQSFDDGLERYRREWFRIDQLYRQFVYAARTAEYPKPLEALREQVEKRYTNKFVYELGNAWQQKVDHVDKWRSSVLRSQTSFYAGYVEPLVRDGDKKAVVIVSDALRYEVADELGSRIRQEDRFDATLDAVLGVLPSYTQLGMAALLPHATLKHSVDGKTVLADDQPTNGTAFRGKILESVGGAAIQAEDFKALNADERRELYKAHRVLYVYHNRIDATGDKPGTERQVFEAVEDTLRDIVDLVKKLASANATNIFITADHGFLFQDEALADTFFLSTQPQGDDIKVVNRRYVLGHGLKVDNAFATFNAAQLGLQSDLEAQIPKSIHRLRLAGGGSRFVHGGATLQEIVVPVLAVNKKRKSDTRLVNVEVWPESDKITTGQVVVRLFQSEPVSEKVQPRTLRAGLYVGETVISNLVNLTFDQTSTDKRDRYQSARMLLSRDANAYNNRAVEFRLEERIPNTNQWRVYAKAMYTLKRSFTSDFDF